MPEQSASPSRAQATFTGDHCTDPLTRVGSGTMVKIGSTEVVTSVNGGYVWPPSVDRENSIRRRGSNAASFLYTMSVRPAIGDSIVSTWHGNGSSGGDGS